MKRTVDYTWRLAELMAARGLHNTTDLVPLLAERNITLSRPQVYWLVNHRPERMSLQVIALCDIFDVHARGPAHHHSFGRPCAQDRHRSPAERRRARPQRAASPREHPRRIGLW